MLFRGSLNRIGEKIFEVRIMFKIFPFHRKRHQDDYLKYQEGEIVPVQSPNPHYPPFLDEDEEVNLFSTTTKKNNPTPPKTQQEKAENKKILNFSVVTKIVWGVILIGLLFYAIPLLNYVLKDVAKIPETQTMDVVKNTNQVVDQLGETKDEVKKGIGVANTALQSEVEKVTEAIDSGKEVIQSNPSVLPSFKNENEEILSYSRNDWLFFITTLQNEKQGHLANIEKYTAAFANEQISQSKYRFYIKGIKRNIDRMVEKVTYRKNYADITEVQDTLFALEQEILHLKNLSISLGSLSGENIIQEYNEGAIIQNQLTEAYKINFKQLLTTWKISYKEKDGVIQY